MKKALLSAILSLSLIITSVFAPGQASAESIHSMSADELEAYIAYLQIVLQNKRQEEGGTYVPPATQPTVAPAAEQFNVIFNGKIYTGTYDGDLQDGRPHGNGTFEGYYQKNKITYSGQWLNGEMSGIGTVEADSYTLHFDITEGVYDRVGSYVGDVVNGLPEGKGTFKTETGASNPWKYTGEWKAGMFNGQGKQTWENESTVKEGTFTNNEFTPTATEAFVYTALKKEYSIAKKSKAALSEFDSCFTGQQQSGLPNESFIDSNFDLKQYKKRPNDYGDKLIYVSKAKVFQVLTWTIGNKNVEQILMETEDDDIYYGFYYGKSNIVEDMEIAAYVLPFDWDTYKNVNDTAVWAVFCAITDFAGNPNDLFVHENSELTNAKVGDTITYGKYQWKVLDITNGRMLVISDSPVCNKAYHSKQTNVIWADCDLRKWLNDSFLQNSFTEEERALICETINNNTGKEPNFKRTVNNGTITKDRVFILKYEEATAYYDLLSNGAMDWWTRTPESNGQNHLFSDAWFKEGCSLAPVDIDHPVRPAMWLRLNSQNTSPVSISDPLKQGDKGERVISMKERLQELGYFSAGATISDRYNATTTERVKLFQKANGLKQTGTADVDTLTLLFSDTARANPY
ncbi:MAG: peptidoglycan-binding protein [Oscillospiraceae bacterium]|nr:peptidoglycan-binding protein [Oscillospiraceae bacterium]